MLDMKLTGGTVADGTGAPLQRADVAVRDGRVVALGVIDEPAHRTVDATDLVVTPGFIDVHTHYDAQAFSDPTLSPSPLHGVTTVVGGNCGFSIAPLNPEDADYLMRMLARVEGMPLEALQQGVAWDWSTTADYLDRLDRTLTPNTGFLVGHSAIRRAIMHDDAVGHAATPAQVTGMQQLLHEGLAAGGMGFSSTWSRSHNDHHGDPVPSRHATREELLALCSVVGEHPGTTLEFIPGVAPFDEDLFDLMAAMSRTADRPINWNVLQVYGRAADAVDRQLAGSDLAADRGGRVVALTLPDSLRLWLNFKSGFILDILNGWERLMALPDAAKLAMLSEREGRSEMDRLAQDTDGPSRSIAHWAAYRVEESSVPGAKGRMVGELATEQSRTAWDVLADLVVTDALSEWRCRTQDSESRTPAAPHSTGGGGLTRRAAGRIRAGPNEGFSCLPRPTRHSGNRCRGPWRSGSGGPHSTRPGRAGGPPESRESCCFRETPAPRSGRSTPGE
jgi:N-acyl-D-aspartate/D-glutamate deacylase